MNWQFFVCIGVFSFALVTVLFHGGWMPARSGSWPLVLAMSAAAGAIFGTYWHLLVPKESWRMKK